MFIPAVEHQGRAAAPSDAVRRLLAVCLDIDSLWSLDHQADELSASAGRGRLLAFADERTLMRLRTSEELHITDVEFLVVVDGDAFASAWGPSRVTGSLARWAWRRTSQNEAHYDESRWSVDGRTVVRIRRKALLTWSATQIGY